MGRCISYLLTSRKPMTELREKFFIIFCLNLVYLRSYLGQLKCVWMKPIAKSMCINICLINFLFRMGETRRCSIAIAFKFCFRICHQESRRKWSLFGIEWDTSADYVKLLGDSINTIKENTETLLEVSRDVSLEINAEKTKYMIMSRHPNSGQNQNIRIANELFEDVAMFKYLGITLTNQSDIHDEIRSRLNSGKDCYHSVHDLLSSRLI
jgi:hypothetical protein